MYCELLMSLGEFKMKRVTFLCICSTRDFVSIESEPQTTLAYSTTGSIKAL